MNKMGIRTGDRMKKVFQVKKRNIAKEVVKAVTPRTMGGTLCGVCAATPLKGIGFRGMQTNKSQMIKVIGMPDGQGIQLEVSDAEVVVKGKSQSQMIRELRKQKMELEKREGYCLSKREIGIRF